MVIEVPPGLQGILDDFFQRPICSEGKIAGRIWCGDVGLPGPDKGKGGKYLLLPPDFKGKAPPGYLTFRSRTYGVFVFWRGFFKDPNAAGSAGEGHGAHAHLSARQARCRQADAVPQRIADACQYALPDRRQRVRHAGALHRARVCRSARTWRCAACSPRSASSKANRSSRMRTLASCSTRRREPPAASAMRSLTSRQSIVPERHLVQGPALAERVSRQRHFHRRDLQLHRSAHRLLHQCLLDQSGHGREHGRTSAPSIQPPSSMRMANSCSETATTC